MRRIDGGNGAGAACGSPRAWRRAMRCKSAYGSPWLALNSACETWTEAPIIDRYADLIMSELNLKSSFNVMGADEANKYVATTVYALNPLPRFLGPRLGKDFKRVQAALKGGKQDSLRPYAEQLLAGEDIKLELDGVSYDIKNEECEVKVSVEAPEGAVEDGGYLVVLDTQLSSSLVEEGLAREVIRRIQNLRKVADFKLDDRIEIVYSDASDAIDAVMQLFSGYISQETLADDLRYGVPTEEFFSETIEIKGETLTIGVKMAS